MTPFGPLFWYELRRLPRRRAMHVWRMLYAAALLLGLIVVYLRMFRGVPPLEALANPGILDRTGTAEFANSFLMAFLAVQQIAVIVLTPIYAAGSIADEKERRSLDFLLSSPLSRFRIVFGKVCSRLVFIGGILAAGLPVLMLTMLFGGGDLGHLLAGFAVSAITAMFLANLGVCVACAKSNLREALPPIAMALLTPGLLGMCGLCHPAISAVSPMTVLGFLFRIWFENDPVHDSTWELVAVFAGVHGIASIALFRFALGALGGDPIAESVSPEENAERLLTLSDDPDRWRYGYPIGPPTVNASAIRRTYDVPSLGREDNPLVWKERYFRRPWYATEGFAGVGGLVAGFSVLAGCAFILLIVLFVEAADELARRRSLANSANSLLASVFPAAVALWPAYLGVRAATAVGRERAAQTLQTLFALPGARSEILKAAAGALLLRDRWAIRVFGVVLALGCVNGAIYLPFGISVVVLMAGSAVLAIAIGIWLSVQIETPARASFAFLVLWCGLLLAPWFVAPLFPSEFADRIRAFSPPHGMSRVLITWQNADSDDGIAALETLAAGLGMLALAGGFAWHAVRTFEREGK